MTELKPRIHDKSNGLDYVLVGDYYVPDLKPPEDLLFLLFSMFIVLRFLDGCFSVFSLSVADTRSSPCNRHRGRNGRRQNDCQFIPRLIACRGGWVPGRV